jgi:hypothetical protein
MMNAHDERKLKQLEDELHVPHGTLPIKGVSNGYLFTEVDGVTVLITSVSHNPRGGYKIPSVCTYDEVHNPTNLDAAVNARKLFQNQAYDPNRKTGHLGPIVNTTWDCGDSKCRCHHEQDAEKIARST